MAISRRTVLTRLTAAVPGMLVVPDLLAEAPEPLKVLGQQRGLYVGNAINVHHLRDPAFLALMARECNMLVEENEGKWQALEPRHGQ